MRPKVLLRPTTEDPAGSILLHARPNAVSVPVDDDARVYTIDREVIPSPQSPVTSRAVGGSATASSPRGVPRRSRP
jgi:hypothetical protein